ncbi:CoA-binding protein [Chelativorans sp. YIM 93263]|uniref:CoA-binding protein n=1 Tax=Chelativorans sp. YIM 93263 TaxID=2906648 RepID=UPI0023789527|nr:CoA-binding protein [Chelativorans sp. YIM 93263]
MRFGATGDGDAADYDFSSLDSLLAPSSVAIVGASGDTQRIGGRPIDAMLKAGFKGRILPVNPNRVTVQGLACYPSVDALPEVPDTAIIAVPPAHALKAVEDLGGKGCRSVTLFTAGFAELGTEGSTMQEQLLKTVRRHGMRMLGPNSLGVFNATINYYGTFSSSLELAFPLKGNIGIASQSGAYGGHLAAVARQRNIGAPVLVATGNEADISVGDVIGWMAESDSIDVICA